MLNVTIDDDTDIFPPSFQAHFQMKSGEMTQEEQRMAQSASMSVSTGNFLATAMQAKQAERQTISTHVRFLVVVVVVAAATGSSKV